MFKCCCLLCVLFVIPFFGNGQDKKTLSNDASFAWGINGHPLTQHAYRPQTWDAQLSFLNDLQINHYRIDIPLDVRGWSTVDKTFTQFVRRLKANQVKPMPVVFPVERFMTGDSVNVYEIYFSQGNAFANRYGDLIEVMEVGNEWDLKVMIQNPLLDGRKAEHYDAEKSRRRMWLLAGFIDGLKSVKPDIKISLSLTWTHWYYLDLLQQYQIKYDIIGYHWYSSMGDITNVRAPYGDILPKIRDKYKKDIWITEFNTYVGTRNVTFEKQKTYLDKNLKDLLAQKIIKGFFIYELFDQPHLRPRYPKEADYGLIYKTEGDYQKKPAYYVFKQVIAAASK